MAQRLVVVGGDAAGMSAASQARRFRGPDELEIVAFERGSYTSYSACGIPYYVEGLVEDPDRLISRRPHEFRERQSIDVHLRHEVVAIDVGARRVRVRDLDAGAEREEPYDVLVLGTGARPVRPSIPGADAEGVLTVHHHEDGIALRRRLEERPPARAVIVGGGAIGVEMAEALRARDIPTALVELMPQPLPRLDPDMGALVADALRAIGVEVYLGEPVTGFSTNADGSVRSVRTQERELEAELVIVGLGVRPNVELARDAGIELGPTGAIATDDRMRTSAPDVFAAGDCAETLHRVSGRPVAFALGTYANRQGRVIGGVIAGRDVRFPGVIGTALTRVGDVEIGRTGLGEIEATEAGFVWFAERFRSTTQSGYMPGRPSLTTKVIVESSTGRLLGAQVVGGPGAGKRIDTFAACVWNAMTVEEIANMDVSYVPPLSPLWDPVALAGRRAHDRMLGVS